MSIESRSVEDLLRYAGAFEEAFAAHDWKILESHLTEDVGWSVHGAAAPFGGTCQGRDDVLAAIRESCSGFDHRFDLRTPELAEGPHVIPGGVHFTWVVTYARTGLPDFVLRGEEWDLFRDGRLEFHREKLWNGDEAYEYLALHGASLRPEA